MLELVAAMVTVLLVGPPLVIGVGAFLLLLATSFRGFLAGSSRHSDDQPD